ncbi:hypothetical protein C9439_07030 [archaeon SCG-AAA382B04]|nr:hypothetical protein C9439_07030 [archaeon SCG-AAA382B04]
MLDEEEKNLNLDREEKIQKIIEKLELDSESIVVSKEGRFVPLDEKIGDSKKIEVHRIVEGG